MQVGRSPEEQAETQKLEESHQRIHCDARMPRIILFEKFTQYPADNRNDTVRTYEDNEQTESPTRIADNIGIAFVEFIGIGCG